MTSDRSGNPQAAADRIRELEAEVQRLRGRLADERIGEDLRAALTTMGVAGVLTAPAAHTDLLDQIVATAAHVLKANAASLFLVDDETEELVFEVALGEKAAEVKKFRLPIGQGIAGFTAATGQAIAVADAQQDPRWAQEIGRAVQYIPKSILSVPLLVDDRVIGVLQLLDKAGGTPFDAVDMETAGRFAVQSAIAIAQSRVTENLVMLTRASLTGLGAVSGDVVTQAGQAADRLEQQADYRDTLQIAQLLAEISREGEAARRMTLQIAEAVTGYLRARPRL